MMSRDLVMSSAYMEWAKTRSRARFTLATSGLGPYPLAELPVKIEDLEINGPSNYGYEPLLKAMASHAGVPVECVVATTGASMANHLAMAVSISGGDEVLMEHPAYELLVRTAQYLGADVKRFARLPEEGFRLDPGQIERAITPRTRLIVLTNLHNPSSALTDESTLRRVGEIARSVKARVLVGEVYLGSVFERKTRSASHLGEDFITSNSLTKVYGLSGLRCGWALAAPDITRKMWLLNDLFGVIPAHPAERLSAIAFSNLDRIKARSRVFLDANRAAYNRFVETRDDLEAPPLEFGTVGFPRLKSGSVDAFCRLLREKYETTVVPGSFFEMPEHFRVGLGGEPKMTAEGLERLAAALDQLRTRA